MIWSLHRNLPGDVASSESKYRGKYTCHAQGGAGMSQSAGAIIAKELCRAYHPADVLA